MPPATVTFRALSVARCRYGAPASWEHQQAAVPPAEHALRPTMTGTCTQRHLDSGDRLVRWTVVLAGGPSQGGQHGCRPAGACGLSNYLARSGRDKRRGIRTYVQVTAG